MKKLDLLIFDLDGTIIDSKLDLCNAVNYTLRELGHAEKDVDLIAKYIGRGLSNFIKSTLGEVGEENIQKAREIFMKRYEGHLLDNTVLYPNVQKTLEHFSGNRKAIVTNKLTSMTNTILEGLGAKTHFEKIIGAGDLPENKPSPLPVLTLLNNFKVEEKKAMIIGDMTIDVQTGKNAGILTCSVTYGLGAREDLVTAGPDYIIEDLLELTNIIK